MGSQVEQEENNMIVTTATVPQVGFQEAVTAAYNRKKGKYQVQGFWKGHVPQAVIGRFYGQGMFFESVVSSCTSDIYPETARESGLTIVSRLEINATKVGIGKDLIYTATITTRLEVKPGQYKGAEVQKADATVTDEGLNEALQKGLEKNARLVTVSDRAAKMGDNVKIDFDGSIDGVHFDDGKGENYPLTLGSGSFIDGFEEQIVGHETGDSSDINVTFLTEYHAKELTGKEAVPVCKLLEIQRKDLPKLNDEFAGETSQLETLDEYRADLKKQLEEAKAKSTAAQSEDNVVEEVVENAELVLPAPVVETQCEQMFDDYACRMQSQDLPLEQYLQYIDMTVEKLKEQLRPQAERSLKIRLVLEEVVKAENIVVSEEVINAGIAKMAGVYKIAPEKMKEYVSMKQRKELAVDLKIQEVVDFLVAETKPQ